MFSASDRGKDWRPETTIVRPDWTVRPKNFRPKHFKTADYALYEHFLFSWVRIINLKFWLEPLF